MSFSSCIIEHSRLFGAGYEKFLDREGGFPILDKNGGWVIKKDYKQQYKNKELEYFSFLSQEIIKTGSALVSQMNNPDKFINQFNKEWTKVRLPARLHLAKDKILFNSKLVPYEWLSNFYPTLIYDPSSKRIYYSVETAYQALKFKDVDENLFKQLATSRDPIKAKKLAKDPVESDEEIQKRIELMNRLVRLKFSQNPVLKEKLDQTEFAELVEHTDSKIWGDGLDGSGKNELGKIIEKVRKELR